MRDCCAKGSFVSFRILQIPQTKPSIKWEPDSGMGFSLILLTILNPLLSLWTHRPSCAAWRPPLGPLMAHTFITWADGTSIKRCSASKMANTFLAQSFCLFERSLESNRTSGNPWWSTGDAVLHLIAGGTCWGMHDVTGSLMTAYFIGFLQQSLMNICVCHFQWPNSWPQYHYRNLSGITGSLWWYLQSGSTQ